MSCSPSSLFHILPPSRIKTGIDASMITSLFTCRLVLPARESTIAQTGTLVVTSCDIGLDLGLFPGWKRIEFAEHVGQSVVYVGADLFEDAGMFLQVASAKYSATQYPNMIGSETFIMVHFRCSENSALSALAAAICSA